MLRFWQVEEIPPAPLYERGLFLLPLYERGSLEIAPLRKGVLGSLQSVVSGVVLARPDL